MVRKRTDNSHAMSELCWHRDVDSVRVVDWFTRMVTGSGEDHSRQCSDACTYAVSEVPRWLIEGQADKCWSEFSR